MKNKVSMQDIADSLGVSKVTVSKVLRGKSDVSKNVREKVLDTAERLGYQYGGKSRRPVSKITILTAEHFFGGSDCFYVKLYRYLSEELEKLHIDAILTILDRQSEQNGAVPEKLKNREADGIIVMGQMPREYLEKLQELQIPMVFLDFYYDGFNVTSVNTDNFFSAYELTDRLILFGHTKIGFVGNLNYTSSIQDRFLGTCKALIEHHLPLRREWVLNDRQSDGRYLDIRLPGTMPTAFVCNCDEVAGLLIRSLEQKGFRVPLDVSVAGFDDSVHAVKSDPQITTVHVNLAEMARLTVKALLRDMGPGRQKNRILSRGKIISRESVLDLRGSGSSRG
ncbi:MAG: LacI family DNA-binding transcriptional regulator [Oscillospiraceae bacterium]|jgi:LacI family transcriptional regulator|nr:LacI family DNA-binding transcriptional regulator [Oscillospiraceae bacterium]